MQLNGLTVAVAIPFAMGIDGELPENGRLICDACLELYRAGRAQFLMASGVYAGIPGGKTECRATAAYWISKGVNPDGILNEVASKTTRGQAEACPGIARKAGCQNMVLVGNTWQSGLIHRAFKKVGHGLTQATLPVMGESSKDWADNAKWELRSPIMFRLYETAVFVYFLIKGWI